MTPSRGGKMGNRRTGMECPSCGSADTPKLIVRGSGADFPGAERGVTLRCRSCHYEWSDDARKEVS
jgi:uncharacterized Zn finger protein